MTPSFAQLGLPKPLVRVLTERGITEPFPVQSVTIPDVLAGRDVSGRAPTGSGKTLAFGLPLLARIGRAGRNRPLALILAPTRELADQITQDLVPLARVAGRSVQAVYGGVAYGPQKNALRKGVDLLVATPGRLEDLIQQRAVDLSEVGFAVVDEADRMADMGFMPAVRRLLDATSSKRQTLLFSATLDGDIAVLSRDYQRNPVRHEVGSEEIDVNDMQHHFWLVDHHDRVQHAADVIEATGRSVVFTRTRHGADRLAKQLARLGVDAVALHGGRSQHQRRRALEQFSSGRTKALIATDVAARGIHIDAVACVLHFDPPDGHKDYLHRSGRTARAGATGTVVSLVTGGQKRAVRRMQRDLDLEAPFERPRLEVLPRSERPVAKPRPDRPGRDTLPSHRSRGEAPAGREAPESRAPGTTNGNGAPSLYVANLPWDTTAADIRTLFGRFGKVHQATVIIDKRTGRSKGFGFVDMPKPAARSAIESLHGSLLEGRDLTVRFAQPRRWGG